MQRVDERPCYSMAMVPSNPTLSDLVQRAHAHALNAAAAKLKADSFAASADDYDHWGLEHEAASRRGSARELRVAALIEDARADALADELARRAV